MQISISVAAPLIYPHSLQTNHSRQTTSETVCETENIKISNVIYLLVFEIEIIPNICLIFLNFLQQIHARHTCRAYWLVCLFASLPNRVAHLSGFSRYLSDGSACITANSLHTNALKPSNILEFESVRETAWNGGCMYPASSSSPSASLVAFYHISIQPHCRLTAILCICNDSMWNIPQMLILW